jgi:hypothetical protein
MQNEFQRLYTTIFLRMCSSISECFLYVSLFANGAVGQTSDPGYILIQWYNLNMGLKFGNCGG